MDMKLNTFIKTLIINDTIFWFSNYLFLSIASIHIAKNMSGGSTFVAGIAFGTYFLLRGITDIISPNLHKKLSDKNKINTLIVCIITIAIAFLVMSFINDAYFAIALFALIGICIGIYNPIKLAFFSEHLDKNKEEKEWGLFDGFGLIFIALASYIGSYLAETIGFIILLRISSIGFLISILPLFSAKSKINK